MSDASFPLLSQVDDPSVIRGWNTDQLCQLASELRSFLIKIILEEGGHFSANLGVVELTVALHAIFNTPQDKLIWDVGHQAYGHKVLTGRREELRNIRKKDGISGFPKISESPYDTFGTGHSSTSISAAMGLAEAALLKGMDRYHIAVIGDGSLTAGMAWEALNNLGTSNANVLVIINDNQIGIDPNPGALNRHLSELPEEPNIFRSLGLPYTGPVDGHDLPLLLEVLSAQKQHIGPRILHLKTTKGKGFAPAEKEQTKWHSAAKYVKVDKDSSSSQGQKYQDVFGNALVELARMDERVLGITPAMPTGSSMIMLQEEMPDRVFDVGIAEQHAVTFSAGLALEGMRPFCHIYSTFMQRAYDQLIHDVALQNIPVIFCLDRAGVVGEDGATHHGLYDLAYLKCIPNMVVAAPSNEGDLRRMMFTALHASTPFALRYPKGQGPGMESSCPLENIPIGRGKLLQEGSDVLLLGLGHAVNELRTCAAQLQDSGIRCGLIDMRFLKPLDTELLEHTIHGYSLILTLEDGCLKGGFGEEIAVWMKQEGLHQELITLGFPDEVIGHDSRESLLQEYGLDADSIVKLIRKHLNQNH